MAVVLLLVFLKFECFCSVMSVRPTYISVPILRKIGQIVFGYCDFFDFKDGDSPLLGF